MIPSGDATIAISTVNILETFISVGPLGRDVEPREIRRTTGVIPAVALRLFRHDVQPRPYCALFSVTGLLVHRIARIRCPFSLPVPGGKRRKRRERKMRIFQLRRAQLDHKVSSAEMHVKRFKRAPEVSFALSFPSHLSCDPRFHCSFRPAPS